ncbi:MAG TPA: extracellular solute-binding protein [Stellaceae bacterium]|jgi:iron(III) transport system substrate-binding protein|nr:extracellular solute-binding protein [Stellaceae bacterium]
MRFLSAFCAALLLSVVTARAADIDPALVDAAKKEGEVTWYSTLIVNQILRPMVDAFNAKYPGIKVNYSRSTNSDVALKIVNEARARRGQADVFDGTNSIYPLLDAGLVADYRPKAAAGYPADLKDANGMWTAMNAFFLTTCYNTNLVKADEAPKTYDDLLDPKWKGKIAWVNDPTPQGPPGFIHNILVTMGEDKGMAYLKKFAAQEPVFIPASQRVVLDKVIAGEYPLAVMTMNHHAAISAKQGAPVAWIKMQPLSESINLIGIVKQAPHPNAARLLTEFVLSDEGQKVLADNDYVPVSPSVPAKIAELKPDAGHFTANIVTPDMARDDLPKWTALYHELFR